MLQKPQPWPRATKLRITAPVVVALSAIAAAQGEDSTRQPVSERKPICVLSSGRATPFRRAMRGAIASLEDRGWPVAKVVERIDDRLRPESLRGHVVVAVGSKAVRWASRHLPKTQRLYYCLADHRSLGLDKDARCYGITTKVPIAQQLALLTEVVKAPKRIGVIYDSKTPSRTHVDSLRDALGNRASVVAVDLREAKSTSIALRRVFSAKVDAVWTYPDSRVFSSATVRALLLAALRRRVPVFGYSPAFVRSGAVIGVGVEARSQGVQVAKLLVAVESGSRSDAPRVVDPEFSPAINSIVAKRLRVALPASILERARWKYGEDKR